MKQFVSLITAFVFAAAPQLDASAAAKHPPSKAKIVKAKASKGNPGKATPPKAPKARKALAAAAAVAAVVLLGRSRTAQDTDRLNAILRS